MMESVDRDNKTKTKAEQALEAAVVAEHSDEVSLEWHCCYI